MVGGQTKIFARKNSEAVFREKQFRGMHVFDRPLSRIGRDEVEREKRRENVKQLGATGDRVPRGDGYE